MPERRPRLTRAQWAAHVEQQTHSELSVLAYCQQHDLSDKTFGKWKIRLRDQKSSPGTGSRTAFTPVRIRPPQDQPVLNPTVTLSLGNGMVLSITGSGQPA